MAPKYATTDFLDGYGKRVLFQTSNGVTGAARIKPTAWSQERRQANLVDSDGHDEDTPNHAQRSPMWREKIKAGGWTQDSG